MTIQLFRPKVHQEAIDNVVEVLKSGWIGLGPKVELFETKFAEYLGTSHAVAFNSGTEALRACVELLHLPKGSYVISTPNTFVATNHVILQAGLNVVFADIDFSSGNISIPSIDKILHDDFFKENVSAIMVVHYGGNPVSLQPLYQLAQYFKLPIIEDCAHAHGSTYAERRIGCELTDLGCFPSQTTIITKMGPKHIRDIKEGEEVLTLSDEYHKVIERQKRSYGGNMVRIGFGKKASEIHLCATENHLIYIYRQGEDQWVEAKDIRLTDKLYVHSTICRKCGKRIPFWRAMCNTCIIFDTPKWREFYSKMHDKGKNTRKAEFHHHFIKDVQPLIAQFEQEGYRVIPTSPVIPDLILIKDGKIIAVEVENKVSPRISKQEKYHYVEKYYDDIKWILREPKLQRRGHIWEEANGKIRVPIFSIKKYSYGEKTPYKTRPVYNLSVEGDPTYYANGVAVHNSFSFHAVKPLTTGDGGMLVTSSSKIAEEAKKLRWFGIDKSTFDRMKNTYSGDYDVTMLGYKCLHRESLVRISGKKTKCIMGIVNQKYPTLISLNNDGKLVVKNIKGWFKNELNNRKWYFLTHEFAARQHSWKQKPDYFDMRKGVYLTEDHPVLTINGYIPVNKITENDYLITASPGLTAEQQEFIIGTLLGDGSIIVYKRGREQRAHFGICHGKIQKEWLLIKQKYLQNFASKICEYKNMLSFQTEASPIWSKLRKRFYPNDKKAIPLDLQSIELSKRALAAWYMDDGTLTNGKTACLCTDGFTVNDIAILMQILLKLGYQSKIWKHEKYMRIAVDPNSSFLQDIAPFIIPSMRYKLPQNVEKEYPYNISLWQLNLLKEPRFTDKPIVYQQDPPRRNTNKVYCLNVEDTHNFIVGSDIIVGNSHMNDIEAAIGLGQLIHLDEDNARRQEIVNRYRENLSQWRASEMLRPLLQTEGSTSSNYLMAVLTINSNLRYKIVEALKIEEIQTGMHYKPNYMYKMYWDCYKENNCKEMEVFYRRAISLPIHLYLSNEEIDKICGIINDVCEDYFTNEYRGITKEVS